MPQTYDEAFCKWVVSSAGIMRRSPPSQGSQRLSRAAIVRAVRVCTRGGTTDDEIMEAVEIIRRATTMGRRPGDPEVGDQPRQELEGPSLPAAALDAWRRLAGQLERVVAWQVRIVAVALFEQGKTRDEIIAELVGRLGQEGLLSPGWWRRPRPSQNAGMLKAAVEIGGVTDLLAKVHAGAMLRPRDIGRYHQQDRMLTKMLATLGRQKFRWADWWQEKAETRRRRKAPLDLETVKQDLKTNFYLLRGVTSTIWAGDVSVDEHLVLGASPYGPPDFGRLLPAVLLAEHFRETGRHPDWSEVAHRLDGAGRWPEASGEAVRKAVGRVVPAARKELYRLFLGVYERERLMEEPHDEAAAEARKQPFKDFVRDRMRDLIGEGKS